MNWHWFWVAVFNDRLEIAGALWFVFSCAAVTMPHPEVPWDSAAIKRWIYDFVQIVTITKNPRLAAQDPSVPKP